MPSEEKINFQIPEEKMNGFIVERLIEIEARMILSNAHQEVIYGMLKKDDPDFDLEKDIVRMNDELRKIRLELCAAFIKKFS